MPSRALPRKISRHYRKVFPLMNEKVRKISTASRRVRTLRKLQTFTGSEVIDAHKFFIVRMFLSATRILSLFVLPKKFPSLVEIVARPANAFLGLYFQKVFAVKEAFSVMYSAPYDGRLPREIGNVGSQYFYGSSVLSA